MRIAVFILARSGSKRIPGKNKKEFIGSPLIKWTAGDASNLGYPVYLLTDDDDIKRMINKFYNGIIVIQMPEELAGDVHDLRGSLEYLNGYANADVIILLQPTSPVRSVPLMTSWISDFTQSEAECGLSAFPLKNYLYDENGINLDGPRDGNGHPNRYAENGAFYIFKKEMLERSHITDGKRRIYPDIMDVELDTVHDWRKLETLVTGGYYEN